MAAGDTNVGTTPCSRAKPNQRGIRFSAHLVFDPPVREFFTKASQFLVVAEPLRPASGRSVNYCCLTLQ